MAKKTEPAPTTPDPIEIAMEAEAGDAALDSPARTLLVNQNRLVGWQIASERAGFALKVLTILVGLSAAGVLALMARQASQADGLVVEPFSVPPQLVAQGLTGAVVAGEVLDRISGLNQLTTDPQLLQLSDSWSTASQVQIPQTGVSIDELERLLRRKLGHETHVGGAVVITPSGIALSARTGAVMVRAEGQVSDLPALSQSLAEDLLRQTQPTRYARMLVMRLRFDEAASLLTHITQTSNDTDELGEAHFQLGSIHLIRGEIGPARAAHKVSLSLGRTAAHQSIGFMERAFGRDSVAFGHLRRDRDYIESRSDLPEVRRTRMLAANRGHVGLVTGDFSDAERRFRSITGSRTAYLFDGRQYENHMRALIGLHEPSRARVSLPLMLANAPYAPRAHAFTGALTMLMAADEGDWAGVIRILDEVEAPPNPGMIGAPTPDAWRALALARLGRVAEARVLAARLPDDCYRCQRSQAEVAEAVGDRAGADRAFAEAVRRNPDLPFAETDWARVLLARGDIAGALAKARAAHRKQQAMADPLEVWGEALLAQGEIKGAAAKFAEAAKLAPRWGRLHLKWGEALAALGKAEEARAKWRAAATMDLSAADRAALKAHGV